MSYNEAMNKNIYFEIQADDVNRAVSFYREVFGWSMEKEERLPIEYWRIETSFGAILKRPTETPPVQFGTNAFVCSFEVSDFDDIARKIMDRGGRVALPKFAVPGVCWQGYFLDAENNTFGIFQPDNQAQ
jgi:predicted enzyme related to lactoylglutathione lyase